MSTPDAKRPSNSDLPEEIILEILPRLPVKTLLRFKGVCKKWYAIIASHKFVKKHYDHKSNKERLLIGRYTNTVCRPQYALFVDDTLSTFEEPPHLQLPNVITRIMAPVNGVFCLAGESGELALLNPATRQLKPLPRQPYVVFKPNFTLHNNVFGFGLDPLSGDYKVVSMWYMWDESANALRRPPLVFVYSSGTNSWRQVASFESSYTVNNSTCDVYLNGVYYWILREDNVAGILALDMSTEKFEVLEVPDGAKSKWGYLSVHEGSIALITCELEKVGVVEIWVMEEERRWNRVAAVGPFRDMSLPVCLWKSNELFLHSGTYVFSLYNIFTKNITVPAAAFRQDTNFLKRVLSYKESHVSIKGEGDACVLWDASADTLKTAWAIIRS